MDNDLLKKFENKFAILHKSEFQMPLLKFQSKGSAQKLLHQLKYEGQYELGVFLGEMLGKKVKSRYRDYAKDIDIIVPIPIHSSKRKTRGYNQSEAIVEGLIKQLDLKYDFDNLIRHKKTATQTKKSKVDRWQNVSGIYRIQNTKEFEGKSILLVDDVVTTGATIIEAAELLIRNGASSVSIACIAIEA
ncbi:MAG: phosphoribosyltransferase family protein [bacterium]|nr:phosphoribosyltransferase family protein [bacterium]